MKVVILKTSVELFGLLNRTYRLRFVSLKLNFFY